MSITPITPKALRIVRFESQVATPSPRPPGGFPTKSSSPVLGLEPGFINGGSGSIYDSDEESEHEIHDLSVSEDEAEKGDPQQEDLSDTEVSETDSSSVGPANFGGGDASVAQGSSEQPKYGLSSSDFVQPKPFTGHVAERGNPPKARANDVFDKSVLQALARLTHALQLSFYNKRDEKQEVRDELQEDQDWATNEIHNLISRLPAVEDSNNQFKAYCLSGLQDLVWHENNIRESSQYIFQLEAPEESSVREKINGDLIRMMAFVYLLNYASMQSKDEDLRRQIASIKVKQLSRINNFCTAFVPSGDAKQCPRYRYHIWLKSGCIDLVYLFEQANNFEYNRIIRN